MYFGCRRAHLQSHRRVFRPRQDHRPHHDIRSKIGEEKRFGGLFIKADACYTRDVTEEPRTTSFVEVVEIESDDSRKKIFSGWMFAESPGLSAVEHPIYDVWLTGCRDPNAPPPVVEQVPDTQALPGVEDGEPED